MRFLVTIVCNVYICICFCYSIPLKELRANIRVLEGFRDVITDSAASMRPLNPLAKVNILFLAAYSFRSFQRSQFNKDNIARVLEIM
jgi:hypothetical protein